MSIDNSFERIATALERIADALADPGFALPAMVAGFTTTAPNIPAETASAAPVAETASAAPVAEPDPAPESQASKPKRGRKPNTITPPAPGTPEDEKPEAFQEPAPAAEPVIEPVAQVEEAPELTIEEVRAIAKAYAVKHGKPAARDLISTVGKAPKLDEVAKADFVALVNAFQTAMDKAA